ncbi:MAG: NUDIX domain-containing protein [bacterium]|nr:NUDIX domain-containing protein [bacterium]
MMKLLLQIVLKIRRFYWWLVRPTTKGARAILVNPAGNIILLRHKYGEGWFLPGGKSKKNESGEETMRRELKEELGITALSQVTILGEYQNEHEYKKDTVIVFVVTSFNISAKKHFEIEMWNFFNPRMLPDETSPGTVRRIQEWLKQKPVSQHW